MSEDDSPQVRGLDSLNLSEKEIEMVRQVRSNPLLADKLSSLLQQFENEIANGMDAHEAEEAVIEALQSFGQGMLQQWALRSEKQSIEDALQQNPNLQKHAKKNSSGIAPSDQ